MYEIYNILDNDTLSTIAEKFNTTEDELLEINGYSRNYVPMANNDIIVPVKMDRSYKYYTVKKGDNLYQISKNYNVDYNLLLKLNGLDKDDYIYPNQTITLPQSGLDVYLTKQGDTLKSIEENLNTSTDELLNNNKNIYLAPEQIIIFKEK